MHGVIRAFTDIQPHLVTSAVASGGPGRPLAPLKLALICDKGPLTNWVGTGLCWSQLLQKMLNDES